MSIPARYCARRFFVACLPVAMIATPLAINAPADAALNKWYRVPDFKNAQAAATMTYMDSGSASGDAGGRIFVKNLTGTGKYYVKYKPDPRGPGGWNRGTANVTSGGVYFNWSDHFVAYTTGYKFKICKVRAYRPDPCGSALLIEAGSGF